MRSCVATNRKGFHERIQLRKKKREKVVDSIISALPTVEESQLDAEHRSKSSQLSGVIDILYLDVC